MFTQFKQAIDHQLAIMEASTSTLLVVDVPGDVLWDTYLKSFPAGSNEIYRENTEHDCSCCKQFIRQAGNVVAILNGKLVSIWDIDNEGVPEHYQIVAAAMSKLVKKHPIKDIFLHYEKHVGTYKSHENTDTGVVTWNHFFHSLSLACIAPKASIPTKKGEYRTSVETFTRALEELSPEAIETVVELIDQNSLYRGEEYKNSVKSLQKLQKAYRKLNSKQKKLYVWGNKPSPVVAGIRNSAIGTLLIDLSDGMDLNDAVTRYEQVVAPENYKRPTALISKAMISKAQDKVEELGLKKALNRRFATINDLTVNNTIFANRDAKVAMDVFDDLTNSVPDKKPKLDKVEEISIDDFVSNVLPKATAIELMVENKHSTNLVSLIAPVDLEAPNILKWNNNFSWSYNGEVTDAMKERVKAAGGNVTGVLRFSIQWNEAGNDNHNDLDAHCLLPDGNHIFYSYRLHYNSGGILDVDITSPKRQTATGVAVENITWPNLNNMPNGAYKFYVHNYSGRNTDGFRAEIEMDGEVHEFSYDKSVKGNENVQVATVILKNGKFSIEPALVSSVSSREVWGINTQKFHNVSMVMHSPNYWDGQAVGNKHWFFMLTDCINPDQARGFYNEFLRDELKDHRKVFEVLGSKLKTPESDNQLSGVGFSSTKRASILCRVSGSFSRILKINF